MNRNKVSIVSQLRHKIKTEFHKLNVKKKKKDKRGRNEKVTIKVTQCVIKKVGVVHEMNLLTNVTLASQKH